MTDLSVPQSLLHPLKASVIGFQEEEHDYHFQVEYPDPDVCHTCGTIGQLVRFGKKQVKYRDVPMHGKRVTLWAVQRRFQCKSCESTFTPKFHEMAEDHRMTRRCYDYIIRKALMSTNAKVAEEIGFDEAVVRGVIKAHCKVKEYSYRPTLPRILGIDELYLTSSAAPSSTSWSRANSTWCTTTWPTCAGGTASRSSARTCGNRTAT